jgi:hypothetical protein
VLCQKARPELCCHSDSADDILPGETPLGIMLNHKFGYSTFSGTLQRAANRSIQPSCPRLLKVTLRPPSNGQAVLYPTYKRFTESDYTAVWPRRVGVPSKAEDAAAAETSYRRAVLRSRAATKKFPGLQSFCSGVLFPCIKLFLDHWLTSASFTCNPTEYKTVVCVHHMYITSSSLWYSMTWHLVCTQLSEHYLSSCLFLIKPFW